MNKPLLILAALAAVTPSVWGEDLVPSLVIGTEHVLPRSEYTKIVINHADGTYTLVSNVSAENNVTLSFADKPYITLQNVPASDITTSLGTIIADSREATLTYDVTTAALICEAAEGLEVVVYNVGGQVMLTGRVGGVSGELSVSSLPEGMYIATVKGIGQSLKFIKR